MKDFGENPLIYSICLYSHLVCINPWFEIDLLIFVIQCKHCTFHPRKNLLWLIWIDFIVIISTKLARKDCERSDFCCGHQVRGFLLTILICLSTKTPVLKIFFLCNTWHSLMFINNYSWLTIDNRLLLIYRDF